MRKHGVFCRDINFKLGEDALAGDDDRPLTLGANLPSGVHQRLPCRNRLLLSLLFLLCLSRACLGKLICFARQHEKRQNEAFLLREILPKRRVEPAGATIWCTSDGSASASAIRSAGGSGILCEPAMTTVPPSSGPSSVKFVSVFTKLQWIRSRDTWLASPGVAPRCQPYAGGTAGS